MWGTILAAITGPISSWFKNISEIKQAEHKRDLAVIENQARLAIDKAAFNAQWEMESLRDKDKWLRRFSFVLFTSPVFLAVLSPDYWANVSAQLKTIPPWMLNIWFYMIAGIWGIAELKSSVPALIQGLRKNAK